LLVTTKTNYMISKKIFAFGLAFFSCILAFSQEVKVKQLQKDLTFLASDKNEGRGAGTAGETRAKNYIIKRFQKIGLKPLGEKGTWELVYPAKKGVPPNITTVNTSNVIGYVDNGQKESIVIGAHYDHLGMGDQGSSLAVNSNGIIHNGADDNASGVSGMIALANYYSKNKIKENYNLIFVAFSGEELGLFGSKFLLDNPTFDLKSINCMVNLDMIGHYRADKGVSIGGIGTSTFWEKNAAKTAEELGIKYTLDSSGVGPSDHTSFYLKDIPVLFLFTGAHADYHKPTDDVELINFEGQKLMLNYVQSILEKVNTSPRIDFKKTANNPHTGNVKSSFKVTMGVIPDYAYDKGGMRLDGVSEGKPAAKAGLKAGDVVMKIGEFPIKDVYGYMEVLGKMKKGQETTVEIKRNEKTEVINITF
jgi:Peptidase family M28/PDZ domain